MSNQSDVMGSFGLGLLAGAAIGAGLALLYAPYSGRRTRRLIRTKVEQSWDKGIDQIAETQEQVNEMAEKAQKRVNEVIDTAIGEGLSQNNLGI